MSKSSLPPSETLVINWPDSKADHFRDWKAYSPDRVTKIVIGPYPGSDEQGVEIHEEELNEWLPKFTQHSHLHLWKVPRISALLEFSAGLQCVDVRGCDSLAQLPPLGPSLETLDLGGCTRLKALPKCARGIHPSAGGNRGNEARPSRSFLSAPAGDQSLLTSAPTSGTRSECDFPNLQYVYLDGCTSLESFAPLRPLLGQLKDLRLKGARIRDLREELCLEGNQVEAIRSHFAEMGPQRQGGVVLNAVKVLLVGNGRVGKTTLVKRLLDQTPDPIEPSTHAIQFYSIPGQGFRPLNSAEEEPLTLNFWDFGGQDLYHNTHRIFFQGASIFVVVWSVTEPAIAPADHEENPPRPLSYWLDQVLSVNPEARIVLVRSRADVDRGEVDWRKYVETRHQDLPRVEVVSAFNGWGEASDTGFQAQLNEVRRKIQQVAADQLGSRDKRLVPAGRARVAAELVRIQKTNTERLERREPLQNTVWSREQFIECVRTFGKNLNGSESSDVQDPKFLLEWLHASGYLFQDPKHFGDRLIIDQRWAVDGIYSVLDREKCWPRLLQSKGRFTLAQLGRWGWNRRAFPQEVQELFLSFMLSCEMIFELRPAWSNNGAAEYLLPAALPQNDEDDGPWIQREAAETRGELSSEETIKLTGVGLSQESVLQLLVNLGREWRRSGLLWRWGGQFRSFRKNLWEGPMTFVHLDWQPLKMGGYGGTLTVIRFGPDRTFLAAILNTCRELDGFRGVEIPRLDLPAVERLEGARDEPVLSIRAGKGIPRPEDSTSKAAHTPDEKGGIGVEIGISYAGDQDAVTPEKDLEAWNKLPDTSIEKWPRALASYLRSQQFRVEEYRTEQARAHHHQTSGHKAYLVEVTSMDHLIAFLSWSYLESPYCMFELMRVFRRMNGGRQDKAIVRLAAFPDARFSQSNLSGAPLARLRDYWRDELDRVTQALVPEVESLRRRRGPDDLWVGEEARRLLSYEEWLGFVRNDSKFEEFLRIFRQEDWSLIPVELCPQPEVLEHWTKEIAANLKQPEVLFRFASDAWVQSVKHAEKGQEKEAVHHQERAKKMYRHAHSLDPDGQPEGLLKSLRKRKVSDLILNQIRWALIEDLENEASSKE